jgi:hypothetical protein
MTGVDPLVVWNLRSLRRAPFDTPNGDQSEVQDGILPESSRPWRLVLAKEISVRAGSSSVCGETSMDYRATVVYISSIERE